MSKLPYVVDYMDGLPIHCPRCQAGRGGWVTKRGAKITEKRVDKLHMSMIVDVCGHVYIYHDLEEE